MKKIIIALIIGASSCLMLANKPFLPKSDAPSPLLRHIVMISFKTDAPADSIQVLDDLYSSLSKNPMVKDFEMGVNISPRDTGVVKHVYMTSFVSKEDMSEYKKIPSYQKLFKTSLAIAKEVTVADYWAKK